MALILYSAYQPKDYIFLNDQKSIAFIDQNHNLNILTHRKDHKPSSYLHERLSRFFAVPKEKNYFISYCYDYRSRKNFQMLSGKNIRCDWNNKFILR